MTLPDGWRRRGQQTLFDCPWFKVRRDDVALPGGRRIQYHVVEHGGWVMVVPLLEDGRVVMERVHRWALQDWALECPSGGCDGDPPDVAARRELEEETGYRAERLDHLGRFFATAGHSDERFDLYLATGVQPDGRVRREPTEAIEVELRPLADLHRQALAGEIADGPTALAILLAAARGVTDPARPIDR